MAAANDKLIAICGAQHASIVAEGTEVGDGGRVWRIHFLCGAQAPTTPPPAAIEAGPPRPEP